MSCSRASEAAAEPLAGSATTSSFWLVVEQPGSYRGRDALTSSGFPPETAVALADAATALGGKVVLVREPGRHPLRPLPSRRVWHVQGYPTMAREFTFRQPEEILEAVVSQRWVDGRDVAEPMLLVCTHGKRDRCCAVSGRALLDVAPALPGQVWEASHLGGHRFAPVVLELRTGYQHGRVGPEDLRAITEAAARGRPYLPTCRGHFTLTPTQQAAELALLASGSDGPFTFHGSEHAMDITGPTGHWRATVTRSPLGVRPESCGAQAMPAEEIAVQLQPM